VLPVPVHHPDVDDEPDHAPPARRLPADGGHVAGVSATGVLDLHRARLVEDGVHAAPRPRRDCVPLDPCRRAQPTLDWRLMPSGCHGAGHGPNGPTFHTRRPPASLHSPPTPSCGGSRACSGTAPTSCPASAATSWTCHKGRRTRRRPEPFGRSSAPPPPSPTGNGADLARQPSVPDRGGLLGQPGRAREVFEINQANERSEGVAPHAAVLAQ
jgi:hypothetical protein